MSKYDDNVRIADELKSIDIAMIFLNAGWSVIVPFKDMNPKDLEETINITGLHALYLTKAVLP